MRYLLRHRVVRRTVTIPVVLTLLVLTAALVPVVVVISGPFALRPRGRGRAIRFTLFTAVYLGAEAVGLLSAGWLWVRAGLGTRIGAPRHQDAHYSLLARILDRLYAVGSTLFGLHLAAPTAVAAGGVGMPQLPATPGSPLLVLSRHAGPGDSFLLVHALFSLAHRRPRIVLKSTLMLDPLIDIVLSRLPHCFVSPGPEGGHDAAETIKQLADTMGPADALLVFPEGGNFTPRRRLRAIASLRRRGLRRAGDRARRLTNVLPAQPAGVFAAIDGAPHADVVFVAHTGLDHLQSVRQVWRGVPLTRTVEVAWWTIPTQRVPLGEEARLRWLQDNWAQIDAWIGRSRPASDESADAPSPERTG